MIRVEYAIKGENATSLDRGKKVLADKNVVEAFAASGVGGGVVWTVTVSDGVR